MQKEFRQWRMSLTQNPPTETRKPISSPISTEKHEDPVMWAKHKLWRNANAVSRQGLCIPTPVCFVRRPKWTHNLSSGSWHSSLGSVAPRVLTYRVYFLLHIANRQNIFRWSHGRLHLKPAVVGPSASVTGDTNYQEKAWEVTSPAPMWNALAWFPFKIWQSAVGYLEMQSERLGSSLPKKSVT